MSKLFFPLVMNHIDLKGFFPLKEQKTYFDEIDSDCLVTLVSAILMCFCIFKRKRQILSGYIAKREFRADYQTDLLIA